jgi:hypothetical protein
MRTFRQRVSLFSIGSVQLAKGDVRYVDARADNLPRPFGRGEPTWRRRSEDGYREDAAIVAIVFEQIVGCALVTRLYSNTGRRVSGCGCKLKRDEGIENDDDDDEGTEEQEQFSGRDMAREWSR